MFNLAKHRWGWASAGLVGVLFIVTTANAKDWGEEAKAKGYAHASLLVSGRELAAHPGEDNLRILDARPPERYAAGHIPGAVNLPLAAITRTVNGVPEMLVPREELEQVLGRRSVTREMRVVIYDDIGGIQATRLFWALDYLDHPLVSVLDGGLALWQREGRPISRDISTPQVVSYHGDPRPDRVADRAWVKAHLQDPSVVVVDARALEEFTGQVSGKDVKRPGHIPGAVNVDWARNLTETEPRQFKPAGDLASLYRQAGVTPDKEIVVYCRTGVRASHDYFVLRLLGYPRVRLYDGSYLEWSADPTLPVAS